MVETLKVFCLHRIHSSGKYSNPSLAAEIGFGLLIVGVGEELYSTFQKLVESKAKRLCMVGFADAFKSFGYLYDNR